LPDTQAIDQVITEILGYRQVGDTAKLHTSFADDVSTVSGFYEPPLVGWEKYMVVYEEQKKHRANVVLDRRSTSMNADGKFCVEVPPAEL
jgi:hypothetical protein